MKQCIIMVIIFKNTGIHTINEQVNLPEEDIKKLIDLSYELVVKSLPKGDREAL